ncbi:helicase-related protein, partial [Actinophytocola sp.]|uniref:helicase-related protein n=1 Tax=Actinophytocola sp. TaxID=1872138 RepID=UPI002ED7E761
AKTHGAVEIISTEAASLGGRLRCLVLCDHERAGATLPARLRDVLDAEAGSAWLMLENLVADPRTSPLNPVLVTGRTVAAAEETARGLTEAVASAHPALTVEPAGRGIARITGPWTSRSWVAAVTSYFEEGRCQVLVGTRALLGEGWDARGVNALIDLTTSTTPTSVVQTRGRAVRLDPAWPEKAANTWTVVCVTDRHPKGAADWNRFVRKHDGYLVATPDGEIVSGVAHVDAAFSPYAPPAVEALDAINASMLARAEDRAATRAAWRLGTPFRDELVHTLRIRPARTERAPVPDAGVPPTPPPAVPAESCATPTPSWWSGGPADPVETFWVASVSILLLCGFTGFGLAGAGRWPSAVPELAGAVIALLGVIGVGWGVTVRLPQSRAARILDTVAPEPSVTRFAYAVADALAACGLSRRGAEGVRVRTEPDGGYRFSLTDVDTAASERFALALDEVLSPVTTPRYLVPRYVVRPETGTGARHTRARAWLRGEARADGVVYHAVPTVFGQNRQRTTAFVTAWNRWVSGGSAVYAGSAEGAGVMATHRGADPFAATTVLRVAWD